MVPPGMTSPSTVWAIAPAPAIAAETTHHVIAARTWRSSVRTIVPSQNQMATRYVTRNSTPRLSVADGA